MRICAIIGGLGSQMLKYGFSIYLRRFGNDPDVRIDTTFYDVGQCGVWNGYELDRVFMIEADDVRQLITENRIRAFQKADMGYRDIVFQEAALRQFPRPFNYVNQGNLFSWEELSTRQRWKNSIKKHIPSKMKNWLKNKYLPSEQISVEQPERIHTMDERLFSLPGTVYIDEFDHNSAYYFNDIQAELIRLFQFPTLTEEQNLICSERMKKVQSVALHIRRSDHMYDAAKLNERGYFAEAVHYIRKNCTECEFYIFSEDIDWCKNNMGQLGLSQNDTVTIVDWNQGEKSYRDIQLMTLCQHNIVGVSSFAWWGYFLSQREDKIACAPKGYWLDMPLHL